MTTPSKTPEAMLENVRKLIQQYSECEQNGWIIGGRLEDDVLSAFPSIVQAFEELYKENVLMKEVLHDFADEQCREEVRHLIKILPTRNAIKAMKVLRQTSFYKQ